MPDYRTMAEYAASAEDRTALSSGDVSAVSWAAILVGAAAAAALALVLIVLGFGLGLSSVSPWSNLGAEAGTVGAAAIVWLAFTQLAASATGGYLAGRLRVKWTRLHSDEVFFRDTAHGFMAWAVASLFTAALLGAAISGVLGGGVRAASAVANGAGAAAGSVLVASATTPAASGAPSAVESTLGYYVDTLFRSDATPSPNPTGANSNSAAIRVEALKIFANDLPGGTLPPADRQYLGAVVAQQTGLSASAAEQRVDESFARAGKAISDAANAARQAADTARKAAAHTSLWMFVALALGAFCASLAATFGGRQRDRHA